LFRRLFCKYFKTREEYGFLSNPPVEGTVNSIRLKLRISSLIDHNIGQCTPFKSAKLGDRAEELVKNDLLGKSDPYAVMTFGKQTGKSKTIANSQVGNYCQIFTNPLTIDLGVNLALRTPEINLVFIFILTKV
jgi:hypothetical protein